MVYKWLSSNLSRLWPAHCYLCQQPSLEPGICAGCQNDLPVIIQPCRCCGLSLPDTTVGMCASCIRENPAYTRVISALAYTTPVTRLITGLKFHNQLHYAPLLARLLLARITQEPGKVQAIVPVPLHARRLRERGFNQALEIARPLAEALKLPLLARTLIRIRETAPQSLQATCDRRANVDRAFAVLQPPGFRHIALIDDVMTSGHTASEAAQCLRAAGVETVVIWCAARANSHPGLDRQKEKT